MATTTVSKVSDVLKQYFHADGTVTLPPKRPRTELDRVKDFALVWEMITDCEPEARIVDGNIDRFTVAIGERRVEFVTENVAWRQYSMTDLEMDIERMLRP